jgi:hypothetical protein
MPASVNRLETGHVSEPNDCAITSLANYLGIDYTDVIRVAARITPDGGKTGLTVRSIRRIAALCGQPLAIRRAFDPDEAYGIVLVQWHRYHEAHAAVLREGWVQDRNLVYRWDDWTATMRQMVKTSKGTPRAMTGLLLVVQE